MDLKLQLKSSTVKILLAATAPPLRNTDMLGLSPVLSSGLESALPMQGEWVRSLVGELRSHMPQGH